MSKKFTGITSAGSAIPVYDKDAHSALQNKADVSALTAYQEKAEMTAYQPVGEYYSASNPSGFLTAVPAEYATSGDLEDLSTAIAETFQPQSAMTAYLTAVPEGYATVEDVESATSGLQEKGDYYSASNPSGFISTVPDTYLQNTDLTIVDNKVTEISGVPLSAGDELPATVMDTSGLEYNSQGYINGYNGSAVATIDQERQWFTHDDTLCHISNSAQYALGVSVPNVAQQMGVDETVLFSGYPTTFTSAFTASETIANFDRIRVSQMIFTDNEYITENHDYNTEGILLTNKMNVGFSYVIDNGWKCWGSEKYHITNGTGFTMARAGRCFIGPNTTAGQGYNDTIQSANGWVYKVVGIHRINGGN